MTGLRCVRDDGWLATWTARTSSWSNFAPISAEQEATLGKRIYDRTDVRPFWALDRPHVKTGAAPPTRLVQVTKKVTRPDCLGEVWFDASHYVWKQGRWFCINAGIVTEPFRLAAIWIGDPPSLPEWREVRQRIRTAAQLGSYPCAELPEGYR